MWDKIISLINALIVHALLLLLVFFSVEWSKPQKQSVPRMMQATVVNENQLLAEIKRIDKKVPNPIVKDEKVLPKEIVIPNPSQELEKKRKAKELEEKRKAEEKARKLAAEKKRKAEAKRKAEEKARKLAVEKKRKAEAKRKAEEKARKLAAEKKRKAEEKARLAKEVEEKRRAADAAHLKAEKEQRIQQVAAHIQQTVRNTWIRPIGHYSGLSCVIAIRLKPGGTVQSTKIISSSGNTVFDASAMKAVHQASPLPVPYDVYDQFKHFQFKFSP